MQSVLATVCLLIFWVGVELSGRKQNGKKPGSLGELFTLLSGKGDFKAQVGRRALIFALFCWISFGMWESVLWTLFGREPGLFEQFLSVAGVGLAVKGLFDRFRLFYWKDERQNSVAASQASLAAIFFGLTFLMGSWVSALLMGPWIYFRFRRRESSK